MLIENPDALKSWLVVILEPLCDADSSALARYVLALLKKEKPEKELKKVMIEQLDVFLGEETTPFVDKLFDAINSKEYLIPLPPSISGSIKTEESELDAVGSDDTANAENVAMKTENGHEPSSSDMTIASTSSALNTNSAVSVKPEKVNQATVASEPKSKETHHHNHQKTSEISNSASTSADSRSTYQSTNFPAAQRTETAQSHAQQSSHHHSHHHSSTSSNSHVRSASPPARTTADKENQPRDSRRRRASLRSRSRSPRSRSRSNERFTHNASRDRRANDREKNHRQFRNKSPPSSGIESRHNSDRRRISGDIRRRLGGGGSSRSGNNPDERSPRFSGLGAGSADIAERKQPRNNNTARSHSRSRSPSVDRGLSGRTGKTSPNSNNRQLVRRPSTERHRSNQNLEIVPSEKRQRCVDFEEKGYCMRGETCPWDHGINPVVFEGVNNTSILNMSLREYNPDVPELWATGRSAPPAGGMLGNTVHVVPGSINPFTGAVRPNATAAATGAIMGAGPNNAVEYIRGTTVISAANVAFRGTPPMLPFGFNPQGGMQSHLQRELIPVPVLDAGGSSGGQIELNVGGNKRRYAEAEDAANVSTEGPPKRKLPINSRLGPRVNSMQNNCSLELRKVPRGLNTITHLNNHFAKFGKIVNIQISYDSDPEAAIITFSTHAEANVAYRSTEAVLNNRFIKVFWHNQDNVVSSSIAPVANSDGINRKSSHYHLNKTPAVSTTSAASTTETTTKAGNTSATLGEAASTNSESAATPSDGNENPNTALSASTQPSLRLKNNMPPRAANAAIIRKKQEEQAKAVVHLANGLRKRKQELLQSYLKQMKSAVELVERCDPNDPQRSKTLETIKVLQETIDKLRKEIATEQEQAQAKIQGQQPPVVAVAPTIKKTKEQQKKELLDIELELFAQQQEGNDTTAIQKRLEELQRSLGVAPGSGGAVSGVGGKPHFAGGRSVARVRPTLPEGSTRVDRRPKTIVVTGFASEEADFVLGHFKNFGEITKHDMDREIPQLILSYATRISAEQAVMRGKVFKDKRLQISWAPVIHQTIKPNANAGDKVVQNEKMLASGEIVKLDATVEVDSNNLKSPTAKDTLPELRLEDEEEDDENEDRSWRR